MSSGIKDRVKKSFFSPIWLSNKKEGEEYTHSDKDTGF